MSAAWLNGFLVAGIVMGSLYALVALGFNVLYRTTVVLNFAHGDLIMWAPLATLVAWDLWHLPLWLSLPFGFATTVAFGLITEKVAIRPFVARPDQHLWIISTLGVSVLLEQLASVPFNAQPESLNVSLPIPSIIVGPLVVTSEDLVLVVAALLCTAGIFTLYRRTNLGRMLIAVGADPDGARVLGISVRRASRWAMFLAALTAAVAGIAVAPLILIAPSFGFDLVFGGFVAVALGGIGSIAGGLIGGLAVGLIVQLASAAGGSQWSDAILFGTLLCVYLVRPTGLLGSRAIRQV